MARCLVTGGAGFIGSHIVEALVKRGDDVRVFDNLSTGFAGNLELVSDHVELIEGDVSDENAVRNAIAGVDLVFHQAALASVPRSVEDPLATHLACATGTVVVLRAAKDAGVQKFIYAASSSAYGDQPFASKRESDLPMPLSPYAAAKLAGEEYCRAFFHTYGLPTIGLRYFNVFGPRQDPGSPYSAVIPLFITRILGGRRPIIFGDGHQSRDFTYIENVVRGNLLAAAAPAETHGRIINVATGRSFSLLTLIDHLRDLLDVAIEPEFQPPRKGDVKDSLADITLARQFLNYEPQVTFHEGLRRSIDYYRKISVSRR